MYLRISISLAGGLLAAVLLTGDKPVTAVEVAPEAGEILGRGPVHEAFAQPLEEPQPGPVAPKPPPEPIEEQPPAQRPEGDDVQWVPGYWQWDDERGEFLWVSGLWRHPPPARKWVPGSWRETDKGFQWSGGLWTPEASDSLQYLPPPPASVEEGPAVAAPADDCTYVPGLWVYRDTRYVWRAGYWLRCRPNWVWNPAHYLVTPAGYLYAAGCWDYPLEGRGILFAPAYFGRAYPRAWSPSYAVNLDFLPGALFVRSGYRQYYYGDYFTDGYRRGGFTPWVDFSIGRHTRDPLFGYYRTANAGRPWERDMRGLYTERFAGRGDRPPRTLGQQNTIIRNTRNVTNVTVLRPLAQSAPAQTRLVEVNRAERDHHQQMATQLRSASVQRGKSERDLIVRKEAPSRVQSTPKSVQIDVPRVMRTTPAPRIETPTPHQPVPRIEYTKPMTPTPHQPVPRIEPVRPATPTPHQPVPRIEHVKPMTPMPHQPVPRIEPVRPVTPTPHQPKPVTAVFSQTPKPVFSTAIPRVEASKPVIRPTPPPPPRHTPPPPSVVHSAPPPPPRHTPPPPSVVHSAPRPPVHAAVVSHPAPRPASVVHASQPAKPSHPNHKPKP